MNEEPSAKPRRRRGRRGGRRHRGRGQGTATAAVARIYTRGGDKGETGFIGGKRVPKDDPRVEAYGAIDELNATLGAARALTAETDLLEVFDRVQHRLFDLGAELASPKPAAPSAITDAEVRVLEGIIDLYQETLPPLREFILPGGSGLSASLHLARTVCRRAERRVVSLARKETLNHEILRFLNRLSDLLFVLARVANARAGALDVTWKKASPKRAPAPPAPQPKKANP